MGCLSWRPTVVAKLAELAQLKAGWNSYRAAPISPEAIQRALALLDATMSEGTPAPSVVPLSTGGVQIEWHVAGFDLEVEVPSPPGQIEVCASEFGADSWLLRTVLAEMENRG